MGIDGGITTSAKVVIYMWIEYLLDIQLHICYFLQFLRHVLWHNVSILFVPLETFLSG